MSEIVDLVLDGGVAFLVVLTFYNLLRPAPAPSIDTELHSSKIVKVFRTGRRHGS